MTPNFMGHSYVTVTPNIMGPSYVLSLMGLSYVPETHNIMDPSYVEWPLCIYGTVLCAIIEVNCRNLPMSRPFHIRVIHINITHYDELKYGHSYVSRSNDRSLTLQAPPTPCTLYRPIIIIFCCFYYGLFLCMTGHAKPFKPNSLHIRETHTIRDVL